MKRVKSTLWAVGGITLAMAFTFIACSVTDDLVGGGGKELCNGVQFDAKTHFCYANALHPLCSNQSYDPDNKRCDFENGRVVDKTPEGTSSGTETGTSSSSGTGTGASSPSTDDPMAKVCKSGDNQYIYCQFSTGCYALDLEYNPGKTCASLISECSSENVYVGVNHSLLTEENGYGTGVQCSSIGGSVLGSTPSDIAQSCNAYCMWGADDASTCHLISTDPAGNSGTTTNDCTAAIANCNTNGHGVFSDSGCNNVINK